MAPLQETFPVSSPEISPVLPHSSMEESVPPPPGGVTIPEAETLAPLREPEPELESKPLPEPLEKPQEKHWREEKPSAYHPPERRPTAPPPSSPARTPVETEPSALRQAIQEVEQIIDDVNEIVEEMHHVLDLLTKLEKQNKVKDSELESLRSSLASLRRRVEGARPGDYQDQNRRR